MSKTKIKMISKKKNKINHSINMKNGLMIIKA